MLLGDILRVLGWCFLIPGVVLHGGLAWLVVVGVGVLVVVVVVVYQDWALRVGGLLPGLVGWYLRGWLVVWLHGVGWLVEQPPYVVGALQGQGLVAKFPLPWVGAPPY